MKKRYILISVLIAAVLFITIPSTAFAEASHLNVSKEISDINARTEIVLIDNISYKYTYFSDPSTANTLIIILNTSTRETDVVTINNGRVYLDGKIVGSIEAKESMTENAIPKASSSSWVQIGSGKKYVSWAKGTATAVVAAIIAGAIGSPVSVVIALGVISVIAAQCSGGTVYYTVYKRQAGKITNYKWVWSFKASTGDKYGPYTVYSTV